METKRILRFYFKAEELNRTLDNLILVSALRSAESEGGERSASKIFALISAKDSLAELWRFLNEVIEGLGEEEREVLKFYALSRYGISRLSEKKRKKIRKAVIKFTRHARGLERRSEGIKLVGVYYCLL